MPCALHLKGDEEVTVSGTRVLSTVRSEKATRCSPPKLLGSGGGDERRGEVGKVSADELRELVAVDTGTEDGRC